MWSTIHQFVVDPLFLLAVYTLLFLPGEAAGAVLVIALRAFVQRGLSWEK